MHSSVCCRQENANFYHVILGTWGLWICRALYRVRLKGGPQVVWMLQVRPGRSGKQQQQQNSPNLGATSEPIPVQQYRAPLKKPSQVLRMIIPVLLHLHQPDSPCSTLPRQPRNYLGSVIQKPGKVHLGVPSTCTSLNLCAWGH